MEVKGIDFWDQVMTSVLKDLIRNGKREHRRQALGGRGQVVCCEFCGKDHGTMRKLDGKFCCSDCYRKKKEAEENESDQNGGF